MVKQLKITLKLYNEFKKIARKIARNNEDIEDCVQEACIVALKLPYNKGHEQYLKSGVSAMLGYLRLNYSKGMVYVPNTSSSNSSSNSSNKKIDIYSVSVEDLIKKELLYE